MDFIESFNRDTKGTAVLAVMLISIVYMEDLLLSLESLEVVDYSLLDMEAYASYYRCNAAD